MVAAVRELEEAIGTEPACDVLGVPRATFYRHRRAKPKAPATIPRPKPARALSDEERQQILDLCHSERFRDCSPGQIVATLLDEGTYVASERTFYRVLEANGEVRERRNQLTHPPYRRPELLAEGPNELWSWDISKLLGPAKWTYYYLYVILDVFSRYVVGWMIAERETAQLATRLIKETVAKHSVDASRLTVHADRGSSMRSKPVALLLADLGVTKTHSRPYTSTDNPYSEAHFKTMKYRPEFPTRFGSIQDARSFCVRFFDWYNNDHRHSGIAMMTPATVHYGRGQQVQAVRRDALAAAYERNPERFVKGRPQPLPLPVAAWINPPTIQTTTEEVNH